MVVEKALKLVAEGCGRNCETKEDRWASREVEVRGALLRWRVRAERAMVRLAIEDMVLGRGGERCQGGSGDFVQEEELCMPQSPKLFFVVVHVVQCR